MPAPNCVSESQSPAGQPDNRAEQSLRHSLRDAGAYSVMTGAGESYLSAFALQVQATAQDIAWLAAVPPLLGSWMQLFSAWLGERGTQRRKLILGGAVSQALLWMPIALLPLLFPAYAAPLLIASVVLYQAASNLITPQWGSLMRELVPERQRGRYFALRTRIASLTSFIALIAGGTLLHVCKEEQLVLRGFLTLFGVAAIARLVSAYFLSRMHDPDHAHAPRDTLRQAFRSLPGSDFLRFSLFFAFMQASTYIAAPFFSLHMLRNLEFSYLQYMTGSAITVLGQFVTLNAWGRISDRFGNRLILVVTGLMIPALPLLWTLSGNFWYLLVLQAIGGLSWAGFNLSAGNFIYDLLPDRRIAPYMALHNVLMNLGVFSGAMLGGYLATHLGTSVEIGGFNLHWIFPIYGVFALSSVLRLMVAIIFLPKIREVREVEAWSMRSLVFRVTRFHAVSGFVFDIVGSSRKPPRP